MSVIAVFSIITFLTFLRPRVSAVVKRADEEFLIHQT